MRKLLGIFWLFLACVNSGAVAGAVSYDLVTTYTYGNFLLACFFTYLAIKELKYG